MPTPPVTVNAPVAVDVAVVLPVTDIVFALIVPVAEILVTPVMLLLPDPVITIALNVPVQPTLTLPPIPTPPVTVSAPVFVEVLGVTLLMLTVLVVVPVKNPVVP